MKFCHSAITLAGESNIGRGRQRNEDAFGIYRLPSGEAAFAVVTDGIGGHAHGDLASYLCVRDMLRTVLRTPVEKWNETLLAEMIAAANDHIFELNLLHQQQSPMGCTCVAAFFLPETICIANVGDSRFYEYLPERKIPLNQLSVDHKPGPELFARIASRDKRLASHQRSSIILRSVGPHPQVEPELKSFQKLPGATYLLCSDGLYNPVTDAGISAILGSNRAPHEMAGDLIRSALLVANGDNMTAVVASSAKEA